MKHLICLTFLMTGLILNTNAQDTVPDTKHEIVMGFKLNPLSLLTGAASFSMEVAVLPKSSVQFGVQYWSGFTPVPPYPKVYSFARMYGATGSFRFYLSDEESLEGLFLEAFGRYNKLWATNERGTVRSIAGGVVIGKQWIPDHNLSLEIFGGPYYSKAVAIDFNPLFDTRGVMSKTVNEHGNPYNGIWLRAGMTVGFYF